MCGSGRGSAAGAAPTITGRANCKGSALCHPEAVRPVSVREYVRLQGFPENWRFAGSMNARYLQIGNAVPVPLGEAVARSFVNLESDTATPDLGSPDFDGMLREAVTRLRASARNKRKARRNTAS